MIEVEISTILTVYIAVILIGVLCFWLYNEHKAKNASMKIESEKFFWFCTICANTYVDSKHKDISICPRCGSYNKKGE
jgi:Zn finger protein HypA/HybF involved in hydrogenase expression